jgi:two-component system chemotaxis response regulator CheY
MKILIADDSRAMRQVIAHMLREAGFRGHQILEAKDGAQALEVVAADEPDLIISDWNMPEMTGIEFLQKLREADNQTPFGFVTTEVSAAMRSLATASGARFLIGKPFTSDDFHDALCDVID